ncbi:MAG TPA: hypothetical protein VIU15_00315 [Streptomyces sp.]
MEGGDASGRDCPEGDAGFIEEQQVKCDRNQLDRALIFADNAASPEQVRSLLPADSRRGAADRYSARALELALWLTEYPCRRGLLEEDVAVNLGRLRVRLAVPGPTAGGGRLAERR